MIRRMGPGKYAVFSADGKKRLSKPLSKKGALERLRQIEYYKKKNEGA